MKATSEYDHLVNGPSSPPEKTAEETGVNGGPLGNCNDLLGFGSGRPE